MERILGLLGISMLYITGGIILYKIASFVGSEIFKLFRKIFGESEDQ
jgi:hypothetical protein